MDKKKISRVILTVFMLVGFTIGISGCGEKPDSTEEMQVDAEDILEAAGDRVIEDGNETSDSEVLADEIS